MTNDPALWSNFGPSDAPIMDSSAPSAIDILEALDAPPMAIGIAYGVSFTPDHRGRPVATWRLVLGKEEIPGRWVCVGRRFVPVEDFAERKAIQGDSEP